MSAFEKRLVKEIELREGRYRPVMPVSDSEAFEETVPLMQCCPPKFEQKLNNFQLMEGSDATFVCKVSGNPKPKVRVCALLSNSNKILLSCICFIQFCIYLGEFVPVLKCFIDLLNVFLNQIVQRGKQFYAKSVFVRC